MKDKIIYNFTMVDGEIITGEIEGTYQIVYFYKNLFENFVWLDIEKENAISCSQIKRIKIKKIFGDA